MSTTANAKKPVFGPSHLDRSFAKGMCRIGIFFLLVVALAYLLDFTVTAGLRRIPTSKFGAFNRFMSGQVNAEIVINGSSRALTHYDPRVLRDITGHSTFNLGMNASQIDVELAILQSYLKHNTKPKVVIQNLDLFSFETTKVGQIYDPALFVPYLYEPALYEPLRKIDQNVWKWKNIPLYGYTVEDMRFTWVWGCLGLVGVHSQEDYILGFTPRNEGWNKDFDSFKRDNPQGVAYPIEPPAVSALKEIIQLCKSQGIQLIFVFSPEYSGMQSLEKNRPEIMDLFRKITTEEKVPFWDYSDSPISQSTANFYNSQHLNADGANTFSIDVARRLAASGLLQ